MRPLKRFRIHAAILSVLVLSVPVISRLAWAQAQPQHQEATRADFERFMTELSNWGRWGKDDQMGAVNLITPAKRKQAAGLVKEGVSFSLARNAEAAPAVDNPQPIVRKRKRAARQRSRHRHLRAPAIPFSSPITATSHTHMDSLCHFFYKTRCTTAIPATKSRPSMARPRTAILNFKNGILTRGILMDIPRHKGVDYLEPGTRIYPEDLDAWEKKAHLKVGPGDVVFIRTGRWARRDAKGPWPISQGLAGLYITCAKWLHCARRRDFGRRRCPGCASVRR